MASIIYLIFGLALTSMCINVVQLKLSDQFRQASSKIIGLQMAEAASHQGSAPQSPTELQSVHSANSLDNNGTSRPTNDTSTADKNSVNTNSKMLWEKTWMKNLSRIVRRTGGEETKYFNRARFNCFTTNFGNVDVIYGMYPLIFSYDVLFIVDKHSTKYKIQQSEKKRLSIKCKTERVVLWMTLVYENSDVIRSKLFDYRSWDEFDEGCNKF